MSSPAAPRQSEALGEADPADSSSATSKSTRGPVGVFYATREGHTRCVAERVAEDLRKRDVNAVVADVSQAVAAHGIYSAVILAASVHAGRHEREMIEFVKRHRDALQKVPNAFLSVTLSEAGAERADATPQERARFAADVHRMTDRFVLDTGWQPRHLVPVAGALRYSRYNFLVRLIMQHIARQAGGSPDASCDHDYTNWQSLDEFVGRFAAELGSSAARMSTDNLQHQPAQLGKG